MATKSPLGIITDTMNGSTGKPTVKVTLQGGRVIEGIPNGINGDLFSPDITITSIHDGRAYTFPYSHVVSAE